MTLMSFDAAKQALLDQASPGVEQEYVDIADAFGRVLAQDLVSPLTLPPFSNAAMDGYALRAADVVAQGASLPLSLRIAAGDSPSSLPPGTAARIFTGAPVPEGADTVVMQEHCTQGENQVVFHQTIKVGEHIRLAGSDIRTDQVILTAGTHLSAAALGLAASVGISIVPVFRKLRVAVFFTGSELTVPGHPLAPGKIYNSNRYIMRGFLSGMGAEIVDLGIVEDNREATREALRVAAAQADVILASGGMSEGDEDHVIASVRAEGKVNVWKIAVKPGKPLAFGAINSDSLEVPFIGLPGNPVAVWCGLVTLVMPFLRKSQGMSDIEPIAQTMRADFTHTVKGNRLELVRVRRNARGGLDVFGTQDSSVISSAVWADGLALLAPGTIVSPGDMVRYLPGPGPGV